ncbi:protein translocase subunit SecD [Microgenomates bacterium UTCPR1]|nr:protein translocase subunit SecD [Patescibacteria group bacterium]OQY67026.1 MAG: protein translocase subunit SecD [Microgenomates bacterium UTCPR1]
MKNFFKVFFLVAISVLILLIDLPENLKIGSYTVNPLSVDLKLFGINIKKDFKTKLGLDLKGGSHLVFEADTKNIKAEDLQDSLSSARDIIEKRVNFFGVSEPTVQTIRSGNSYRISVDLPGVDQVKEAVALIGKTAQLSFREEKVSDDKEATSSPVLVETGLTGKHIKKAVVDFNQQDGNPQVALSFNDEGAKLFGEITSRNLNKKVYIVVDNFLVSDPVVRQPILDGNAVITSNFSVDEAKKLAISINSGALPISIKLVEQKNIGPTLGATEIRKSVYAGAIGLVAVLLFMILYYGRLGMIASLALIIYGLISLAIVRIIPVVLTLPGIAGFILSIGMAVDSNILIFERIKEEMRKGKDFDIASKLGFGRAIDAIKDANITTLTVAFILFNPLNWSFLPQFGMVRGFALTLAIGVGTSLFTGIVITKRLIKFFYKQPK